MAVGALESNAIGLIPFGSNFAAFQGRAKTSETWAHGAVLIRDTGELAEAAADPVADIVGVAAEGVTSAAANTLVRYYPATQDMVFVATLEDQSNTDHALVEANLYTDFALQVDSNGVWYVDENDTTNTGVIIIGVLNDDDIVNAKVRARVLVRFLADVTIYQT